MKSEHFNVSLRGPGTTSASATASLASADIVVPPHDERKTTTSKTTASTAPAASTATAAAPTAAPTASVQVEATPTTSLSSLSVTHINLNSTRQQADEILFDGTGSVVMVEKQDVTPRFPGMPAFSPSPFSFGGEVVVGTVYPDVTPEKRRLQLLESSIRERKSAVTEQMEVDVAMARQAHLEMARLWRKLTTDVQLCSEEINMLQQQQVQQREMIVQSTAAAKEAKRVAGEAVHCVSDFETEQLELLREQNQKYRQQLSEAKHGKSGREHRESILDSLCDDMDASIDGMWDGERGSISHQRTNQRSGSTTTTNSSNGTAGAKMRMKHGAKSKRRSRGSKRKSRSRGDQLYGFDYGGPDPDPWKVEFSGGSLSEHEVDIITLPKVQLSPQYRRES
jgi:hypothetical protein